MAWRSTLCAEWMVVAVEQNKLKSEQKLTAAFNMFDKNGDRLISLEEIKDIIGDMTGKGGGVSESQIKRLMKDVDSSRRG